MGAVTCLHTMGRRKIEMEYLVDDRVRKVTFCKRKGGLFNKADDLSKLCGVEVAVVIVCENKTCQYASTDMERILTRYRQINGGQVSQQGTETDQLWKRVEDQRREIELLHRQLVEERKKVEALVGGDVQMVAVQPAPMMNMVLPASTPPSSVGMAALPGSMPGSQTPGQAPAAAVAPAVAPTFQMPFVTQAAPVPIQTVPAQPMPYQTVAAPAAPAAVSLQNIQAVPVVAHAMPVEPGTVPIPAGAESPLVPQISVETVEASGLLPNVQLPGTPGDDLCAPDAKRAKIEPLAATS